MKIVAFEDEEADWLIYLLHSFLEEEERDDDTYLMAKSIIFKLSV